MREGSGTGEAYYDVDSVRLYLREIGKVPLLTKEEEFNLAEARDMGLLAQAILEEGGYIEYNLQQEEAEELQVEEPLEPDEDEQEDLEQQGMGVSIPKEELHSLARAYLNDRGGELSQEERSNLLQAMNNGIEAKKRFVDSNLRLVVSIAKRYQSQKMPLLDLIQEGSLGLMRAVEKFDQHKGFKFSTYASWWIRQAITRAIADQARTIRIPVHMAEKLQKLSRFEREAERVGKELSDPEICEKMGIDEDYLQKLREAQGVAYVIALDQPVGEEGEMTLLDRIADPAAHEVLERVDMNSVRGYVREHLPEWGLSAVQMDVLWLRYGFDDGIPKTLAETGKILGFTRERARQIQDKAQNRIKYQLIREAPDFIESMLGVDVSEIRSRILGDD